MTELFIVCYEMEGRDFWDTFDNIDDATHCYKQVTEDKCVAHLTQTIPAANPKINMSAQHELERRLEIEY
jgi:hypothetical protein